MRSALLLCCLVCTACAPVHVPVQTLKNAAGPATRAVLILKSTNNPLFDRPISGFLAHSDALIEQIALNELNDEDVAPVVGQRAPALILAVGVRAGLLAARAAPQTPVLCIMVTSAQSELLRQFNNERPVAPQHTRVRLVA